jgi:hypothetical protein
MSKVVLLAIMAFASCSLCFARNNKNVSLVFAPTDAATDYQPKHLNDFMKATFLIGNFADDRTSSDYIGVNNEEKNSPKYYSANGSVTDFVKKSTSSIMNQFNIKLGNDYDFVINGSLKTLFVTEENTYIGKVQIEFTMLNRNSDTVCTCLAYGDSHRWGRSFSEKMYLECISNSLFTCLNDFMSQCDPRVKK